ncbi:MAG: sigma 54-interacting transcriptional regulator [Pseudomonadota bacterium]
MIEIDKSKIFNTFVDHISDGIYVVDKNMKIVFINQRARQLFNIDPDDFSMIGKHCHDFSKGFLCSFTGSLCKTVKDGIEFENIQIKVVIGDIKEKILLHSSKKILDGDNNIIGAISIIKALINTEILYTVLPNEIGFQNIIGKNIKMLDMFHSIKQVAPTDASVLLLGESGTGKELVCEAIHKLSARKEGPLIKINCSALSENILESELFGHVKGSFTGALRDKVGKFELAQSGTIFLDEIGEINDKVQIKLLRVLQEKEIEKVGDNKTIKINARIIAATNRDLRKALTQKFFREDLYYRLSVFPISVPPLRQRIDDIAYLTEHLIRKYAKIHNKNIIIPLSIQDIFKRYSWPGNVRQLEHTIEYAIIKSKDETITFNDLPSDITESGQLFLSKEENNPENYPDADESKVLMALEQFKWNKSRTAQSLGIGRTTLWRLMKKYEIEDNDK